MATINLQNNTEMELDAGQYQLTISKAGYKSQTRIVTVFAGALSTEVFNLEADGPNAGNIQVNVDTPGVLVRLVPVGGNIQVNVNIPGSLVRLVPVGGGNIQVNVDLPGSSVRLVPVGSGNVQVNVDTPGSLVRLVPTALSTGTGTFRVNITETAVTLAMRLTGNLNAPLIAVTQNVIATAPAGSYTVFASKAGYSSRELALAVVPNQFTEVSTNFGSASNGSDTVFVALTVTAGIGVLAPKFILYEDSTSGTEIFRATLVNNGDGTWSVPSSAFGTETESGLVKFGLLKKNKNYVASLVGTGLPSGDSTLVAFRIPDEIPATGSITATLDFAGGLFNSANAGLRLREYPWAGEKTWHYNDEFASTFPGLTFSSLALLDVTVNNSTLRLFSYESGVRKDAVWLDSTPGTGASKTRTQNLLYTVPGNYKYGNTEDLNLTQELGSITLPSTGATFFWPQAGTTTAQTYYDFSYGMNQAFLTSLAARRIFWSGTISFSDGTTSFNGGDVLYYYGANSVYSGVVVIQPLTSANGYFQPGEGYLGARLTGAVTIQRLSGPVLIINYTDLAATLVDTSTPGQQRWAFVFPSS